ncbi:hypothetical protein ACRAQ6_00070 [Erythrobacter sp. HA6-11]
MTSTQSIAMDGHVHLQRDMPWDRIAANFERAAPDHLHVCLIVESAGVDRFAELERTHQPWGELGLKDEATGLHFIAGRQVVSAEGLEVLHIGSRDQSLEGALADRVIAAGLDRGAAVCLPWGFGKWLGERRRLASELYARLSHQILLGDITNRPALWREPMFSGERVLRGSDNLPMAGSSDSVGAFGSALHANSAPTGAQDIIAMLRDRTVPLTGYGQRKSARASVGEQLRLRLAKGDH